MGKEDETGKGSNSRPPSTNCINSRLLIPLIFSTRLTPIQLPLSNHNPSRLNTPDLTLPLQRLQSIINILNLSTMINSLRTVPPNPTLILTLSIRLLTPSIPPFRKTPKMEPIPPSPRQLLPSLPIHRTPLPPFPPARAATSRLSSVDLLRRQKMVQRQS
jgi:hypothetical protein